MSKLIKVGSRVINLAHITEVLMPAEASGVRVNFTGGSILFDGEEAAALRHYFTGQALDVDQSYNIYLKDQERNRQQEEKNRQFDEFCETKGLDADAAYEFHYWLERTPGQDLKSVEEGFAAWEADMGSQLDEAIYRLGIVAGPEKDAFKVHCMAKRIYRPGWNAFKFWKDEQPVAVIDF